MTSTPTTPKDWVGALRSLEELLAGGDNERQGYLSADADMVERAINGFGPDATSDDAKHGARVVFNLSSATVRFFCEGGYKNAYDLGKYPLGDTPKEIPMRQRIDNALGKFFDVNPRNIYFGALELNGSGVRFYGDISLVLKRSAIASNTPILDRNSYDLLRVPLKATFESHEATGTTNDAVNGLAGRWDKDLQQMVAIKILGSRIGGRRRLTTAHVSLGILDDEDYVEVLKAGTFSSDEIEEARHTSADASTEAFIDSRERAGQDVSPEELVWRDHRRHARRLLAAKGIPMRTAAFAGRVRA